MGEHFKQSCLRPLQSTAPCIFDEKLKAYHLTDCSPEVPFTIMQFSGNKTRPNDQTVSDA